MSDLVNIKNADRYPGLWSFRQDQSDIFYGRDKEKQELFNHARNTQVTILFAKSGIGKSSLLNAGVIPLLTEAKYFPLNILFTKTRTPDGQQSLSPLEIFKAALKPYADQQKSPFENDREHLWEYFKTCQFPSIPVLIFDQFEELFMYPPAEINAFLLELSELIHELPPSRVINHLLNIDRDQRTREQKAWVTQPFVKFIFAIRSDRLSDLQKVDEIIPGVFINRYQLQPMDEDNAKMAIIKPAKDETPGRFESDPFTYDKEALGRITANLKSDITGEIEPYQLQIVCRYIEEKVKTTKKENPATPINEITVAVFDANTETDKVLHNYYEQQLALVGNEEEQLLCRNLLEKDLLEQNNNNYNRIRLSEGKVKERLQNKNELLQKLLEARLIKAETDDYGLTYYQISHDSLKDPILRSKLESDEKEKINADRQAIIEEAKKIITEHYECLKIKAHENALEMLKKAESIYSSLADMQGVFETGILIAKVMESQRDFKHAKQKLNDLHSMLNPQTDHRLLGIVNECFGIILSKDGDEHGAFEQFKNALRHYEAMPDYDQVARMSEHLGGIKEEMFYSQERDNTDEAVIELFLNESDQFYNNATKAYVLINDTFGYERIKRSLTRLQENREELRKPGYTSKPWGHLTELFSGKVHPLKGKGTIRVGRDVFDERTEKYILKNEIGFDGKYNFMSRRHASITPDMVIEDTQSLNGTTINNIPLYYGNPRTLDDGDIIVLANMMPLRFTITQPPVLQIIQNCWALFINGTTKMHHYLTLASEIYSVAISQKANESGSSDYGLIFSVGESDDAIIKFKMKDNKPQSFAEEKMLLSTLTDADGAPKAVMSKWKIRTTIKDNDRFYKDYILNTGEWFRTLDFPMQLQLTADSEKEEDDEVILVNGPTFQLIINEDFGR